jgi:hypothetical protein
MGKFKESQPLTASAEASAKNNSKIRENKAGAK